MPPSQPEIERDQRQPSITTTNTDDHDHDHDSFAPLIPAEDEGTAGSEEKSGKRKFFGLGKKKENDKTADAPMQQAPILSQSQAGQGAMEPIAPDKAAQVLKPHPLPIPISPARHPYNSGIAASPSRLRSSSPRLHSPASSEIFERNVQEPVPIASIPDKEAAHIASHVMTEDHIPPALEASAQAITSDNLNPDEVEIVTSAVHQPAAMSVLDGSSSQADLTNMSSSHLQHTRSIENEMEGLSASPPAPAPLSAVPQDVADDTASNYGQLDPNDVRRLSFISFADVVQSEHQHAAGSQLGELGSRDSLHVASVSGPSAGPDVRAGSPLRSPRSPVSMHSQSLSGQGGLATPPSGLAEAVRQHEQSPPRSLGVGSTVGSPLSQHGDLNIETMRQAVRKTASGDLSGVRASGGSLSSPVSGDDFSFREARSRTNS